MSTTCFLEGTALLSPLLARQAQWLGLALSSGLGLVAGSLFATDTPTAWRLAYATFLWTLIIGFAVVLLAFASGRVPLGHWRYGTLLSAGVFFTQTTGYALALLLLAALGPDIGTLLAYLVPPLYLCSAIMVAFCPPLFVPWVPRPPS